ncbi:MAG: FHA domain-containing protein [Bacteriovoracaceae bacterium]|nr:FHA domain-containing protein [Bacteriovoracaceae bacterium]
MAIYLIITEENEETRIRLSPKPFFMGRSSKCHMTLRDTMISGKHLAVKVNNESRVVIKDLETTNGTYLNGNKIQETFLYVDDFVQIGKVKIQLDDSEMTAKELALHKRDFERTNVTFVRLGAQVEGLEGIEEDEFGQSRQQTLLAKIRKKNETEEATKTFAEKSSSTSTKSEDEKLEPLEDFLQTEEEVLVPKKTHKSKKKIIQEDKKEKDGLVGKLKGLFKK